MAKRQPMGFEDEDLQWEQPGFRQGRDVLLACGQVLAREAGFTRAAPGAPLLLSQILSPEGRWPQYKRLREDLKPFFERGRQRGATGFLGVALAVLQDFREWEGEHHGRFARCRIEGPAFVTMLAAGHLLEGMPNGFSDLPRFFALLDPAPSSWLDMARGLDALVHGTDAPPLFAEKPPAGANLTFASRYGLTPVGMALMGIPPVDTRAAERRDRRAPGSLFEDAPEDAALARPRRRPPKPDPPEKRPPMPGDLPADLLLVEKPALTLADLVLPEDARFELDFLARLLQKNPKAAPVALFHGPPGTGKTHAARCLAGELKRPLGTASLDKLIIKWVGDTEKAMRKAFDDAAKAGALLLLDEADALLSDRSNMTQTWQLSQVNTLLKLLEAPAVPVVLCTNFLRVFDAAVHRRIQHLVEFPVPGPEERRDLWALELQAQGIGEDLDLDALAALPLAGGLIHNAAVQFARRKLVYGDGFYADTPTLLALARQELPKMGREVVPKRIGFEEDVEAAVE